MQKVEIHREGCQNCPNNPEAKKPFMKMTHVKLDSLSQKHFEQDGLKADCVVCKTIEDFLKVLA